ncbi:procathepsin L-like [Oppia nitens]|uniref:procathepsin L-like n=1 Tax=Oppia nitens TaxID=1686743 RepID=UPI0023DC29AF|nr:procathepsin L-like [Oppia nitens]
MQQIIALIVLIGTVIASNITPEEIDIQFKEFKTTFNRNYSTAEEEGKRRAVFEFNYNRILDHNSAADGGLHSFRLGVNQFADLTNDEFKKQMNGFRRKKRTLGTLSYKADTKQVLPETVDWRTKGVVTPIKNQEQCGSCWAFSAVASIEGQHALSTKKLVSLSEQNLVDCSSAEGNQGCNGGLMDQAFEYVIKNKGIDTEKSYPYDGIDEKCHFKRKSVGATVTGFKDIQSGSEASLLSAVANVGPISVAIDASSFEFQLYKSGVYYDTECGNQQENLDHGVTAVGYGVQDGKDYWLVKNSWDTTWGQKGYIFMSRNKDNQCGIATDASFPTGVK